MQFHLALRFLMVLIYIIQYGNISQTGLLVYIWYCLALIFIVALNMHITQVVLHLILYCIMKIGLVLCLSHMVLDFIVHIGHIAYELILYWFGVSITDWYILH